MKLFDKYFQPYAEYCLRTTFSEEELKEALAAREIALAEMKRRSDEYKASQGKAPVNAAPAPGAFNF